MLVGRDFCSFWESKRAKFWLRFRSFCFFAPKKPKSRIICWISTFLLYTVILNITYKALQCFNEELRQFGEKSADLEDSIQKLSDLYYKQTSLTVLVRKMDSIFEVSYYQIKANLNNLGIFLYFYWLDSPCSHNDITPF